MNLGRALWFDWSQAIFAASAEPGWGELAQLGTYALAMIVGAYAVYRFQVLHERTLTNLERARADQEREDRKEAEGRERKMAEATLPALMEANRAMDMMSRVVVDQRPRP